MNYWIDEKAARIKKRQEQAEEARQSGVHEAAVISKHGRDVLDQLEAVVRSDVEKWNAHFPNDVRRRIDSVRKLTPDGFVVHKTGYPTAHSKQSLTPPLCQYSSQSLRSERSARENTISKASFT